MLRKLMMRRLLRRPAQYLFSWRQLRRRRIRGRLFHPQLHGEIRVRLVVLGGWSWLWAMLGALGGPEQCTAPGVQLSEYENALGTGQVHVWFDLGAAKARAAASAPATGEVDPGSSASAPSCRVTARWSPVKSTP